MTRAEELAEKVRGSLDAFERGRLDSSWHTARAALSELVADAEALAEALRDIRRSFRSSDPRAKIADAALARHRGEKEWGPYRGDHPDYRGEKPSSIRTLVEGRDE